MDCAKQADRLVRSLERPDLRQLFPADTGCLGAWFRAFADVMTEAADGRRWIEKSPQNIFCVRQIDRYVADARIVHVVRDGLDNVASIIDAADHHDSFRGRFQGPDRVRRATAYWNNCLRISASSVGRARHVVVRYEDVVEFGAEALRPVAEALDVTITREMLVYRTDGIVRPGEEWKLQPDQSIRPQPSKFTTALSADEQASVRANALDVEQFVPRRSHSA